MSDNDTIELVRHLRAMARCEHEDMTVVVDAAAEIERLRAEVQEQARLLGMGGEREAQLLARVEVLERACRLIEGDPDPHAVAECIGCYRHSRLAYHALESKP